MDKQDDQARDRLTQQRQHDDRGQEAMLERSEEELHGPDASELEEQTRQGIANQRHHQHHIQSTLRERAEEDLPQ